MTPDPFAFEHRAALAAEMRATSSRDAVTAGRALAAERAGTARTRRQTARRIADAVRAGDVALVRRMAQTLAERDPKTPPPDPTLLVLHVRPGPAGGFVATCPDVDGWSAPLRSPAIARLFARRRAMLRAAGQFLDEIGETA